MNIRTLIRKGLQHFGYDIVKVKYLSSRNEQMARLFDQHGISLVFDVGANIGQYAQSLREQGYRGRIVSCEPVSSAFESLRQRASGDSQWECLRCAVGNSEGEAMINIAGNIQSSSLLEMLPEHVEAAPLSRYVASEQTPLTTIDRLALQYARPGVSIFLKTDTQGFDMRVLEGARSTLQQVRGLELEMSFVSLYKGETLFSDMIRYVEGQGFFLASLEPVFFHPSNGRLLQVNGVFFRETP